MKAVIIAGGKGTRLKSITGADIPKPMVKINSKTILERQIESLKESNVVDIIILLGYLSEYIMSYFGDGSKFGVKIQYVVENEPLGSAGALFFLKDIIDDDFFFIYGDLLLDIDWIKFLKFHRENKKTITIFAHPNSHPYDSDILLVDANNSLLGINKKNSERNKLWLRNLTNAGVYVVSPSIFSLFSMCRKMAFEDDVIYPFIETQQVVTYISSEYVKDIGTPERYNQAISDLEKGIIRNKRLSNKQKAIFLDRDGTINKYMGFLNNIDDFFLEENAARAIKIINNSGYLAIVVTNQPSVARGEISLIELDKVHSKMDTLLGAKGAFLDATYFCPHHPDKGFFGERPELKFDCDCRKPKPGLIHKAKEKFNIDLSKSYMIGDTYRDVKTAENAGVIGILLDSGSEEKMKNKFNCEAVAHCANILDAVTFIMNKEGVDYD